MTPPAPFELFAYWRTSATYRVRVALNLKGMTAHERIVDLDAGEQRSEAYLKINPLGAVPALLLPGHAPITQSLAILEFLHKSLGEAFRPNQILVQHVRAGRFGRKVGRGVYNYDENGERIR